MQLTFVPEADNYQVMIQVLSGLVKNHICKPTNRYALARVDEPTLLALAEFLDMEDNDQIGKDLAVDWLVTHKQAA